LEYIAGAGLCISAMTCTILPSLHQVLLESVIVMIISPFGRIHSSHFDRCGCILLDGAAVANGATSSSSAHNTRTTTPATGIASDLDYEITVVDDNDSDDNSSHPVAPASKPEPSRLKRPPSAGSVEQSRTKKSRMDNKSLASNSTACGKQKLVSRKVVNLIVSSHNVVNFKILHLVIVSYAGVAGPYGNCCNDGKT